MPLYEYHCRRCRATFELLRPMSESSETAPCPAGHPGAGRVISLVADRAWAGNGTSGEAQSGGCPSCADGACACAGH